MNYKVALLIERNESGDHDLHIARTQLSRKQALYVE